MPAGLGSVSAHAQAPHPPGFGIGAALLQEGRPIAFLCRNFSATELNYGVGELELLAVVHAMRT